MNTEASQDSLERAARRSGARTKAIDNWVGDRKAPLLSTNHGAPQIAFQDWRRFKEAFAPEVVQKAINETSAALGRKITRCVDPFGGSGTTALACQFMGVKPTTIEVNPYLADLIEAKLHSYEPESLEREFTRLSKRAAEMECRVETPFPGAPPTFVEAPGMDRYIFGTAVAKRIAAYREAIAAIDDPATARFFRVILGAIAVSVSNAVISGKGRRYRKNWKERQMLASAVDAAFLDQSLAAIHQIRAFNSRPMLAYDLLRGDSRKLIAEIETQDLCVFSPPYPNSFDYTDVYNIELWTMGYLNRSEDNRTLRNSTIRSHVQIKRDFNGGETSSPTLMATMERLERARSEMWHRDIPGMVGAYFDDMRQILGGIRSKLIRRGRAYMVVGDSRYAGIDVPVAQVLSEEAKNLGFTVIGAEPCRSMRASPQQGGRAELAETLLTFRAS